MTMSEPPSEDVQPRAAPQQAPEGDTTRSSVPSIEDATREPIASTPPSAEPTPATRRGLHGTWRYVLTGLIGASIGAGGAYLARPKPIDETRFMNFDPDSTRPPMLTAGWSTFETMPGGDTFVWCAAASCGVSVQNRADADRSIRARIWPFRFEGAIPQTVSVSLNGEPIGNRPLADGPNVVSFQATRTLWRKGANDLVFKFAYAESPKDHIPLSQDARLLSAGFDWVEILSP